jgi:hypothetical protein
MKPTDALSYASAAAALAAAVFWLWSARAKMPEAIRHVDLGDFHDGPKEPDDVDKLMSGLVRQSRLSAVAAKFTAAAAVLQAVATLLNAS